MIKNILKDIILRKNLIAQLVIKDLKVRYSRSALNFFWVILSPFALVAILYFIFSFLLKVKTDSVPFALYLMTAVFPWRFFQDSLALSATSLIDNKNLIKESSFPHYFIPLSITISNFIIFIPSLFITVLFSFFCLKALPIYIIFLPFVMVIQFMLTASLSAACSLLYVKFRDTKYVLETVITLLFYLTPAFYSIELVRNLTPRFIFNIYSCNPFVGILNMYRFTIVNDFHIDIPGELIYWGFAAPVLFLFITMAACYYLYKSNKNINDYLCC